MTPNSSPPTSSRGRSGGVSSDGGDFRALVEGRITSKEYVRRLRKRVGEQHLAANGCHSAVDGKAR